MERASVRGREGWQIEKGRDSAIRDNLQASR